MKNKIKSKDHSVKVDNKTYKKILKLAKEEKRSIRTVIGMAIDDKAMLLD